MGGYAEFTIKIFDTTDFFARDSVMMFMSLTMFFSGGLIPSFLLIRKLQLYNTRWAIVLPSAISVWNIIISRTYIQSNIPESLYDAAKIDGANEIYFLWKVIMPLSKPIIAVIGLFTAVGRWNSYFDALVYLSDKSLHPIQLYLRKILLIVSEELVESAQGTNERSMIAHQIRYTVIIITMLPIICVYPFLQKYFVKGVMVGAIKG